jgi:MFS family permease
LWAEPNFLRFWFGQSISEVGSAVTRLALPTVAIQMLGAGSFQVGALLALQFVSFPVLALFAGVVADRRSRRAIMIASDAGRMLAIASIPAAAALGIVSMAQLYLVALLTGGLTVFFEVAYQSYLPVLVDRSQLVEGNAKLELSRSVATVGGPALGGLLLQWLRAHTLLLDAASYLVSVLSLVWIPPIEPGRSGRPRRHVWHEIREGAEALLRRPDLRLVTAATATSNLGTNVAWAVQLLFLYQSGLRPGTVGLVYGIGSLGAIAGALTASRVARALGLGPTLLLCVVVLALCNFALPAVTQLGALTPAAVAGLFFVAYATIPLYNINYLSYAQAAVPDELRGRTYGTIRLVVWGTRPVGLLLGGTLGARAGLPLAIVAGAALALASAAWLLAGPVRLRAVAVAAHAP